LAWPVGRRYFHDSPYTYFTSDELPDRPRGGRGWPGLYFAARSGCRVVLADLPLEGLRVAAGRAAAGGDHPRLLRSAGFRDVTEFDGTPAFRATAAAWLAESASHADELARLEPPGAFVQRQAERRVS